MRLNSVWRHSLGEYPLGVAWASDSLALGVLPSTGDIPWLERASGTPLKSFPGHNQGNSSMTTSPLGNRISTGGLDGRIQVWDYSTGHIRFECSGSPSVGKWIEHVRFSPTSELLASSAGRSLRIWDSTGHLLTEYSDHPSTIADFAWRPDGQGIAAACHGGARLYRSKSSRWEPFAYQKLAWKGSLISLQWAPNGRFIAAGSQESTIQFWRLPYHPGEELFMSGYANKVKELSWDCSSRFLASGGGAQITIWDVSGKGPAGTRPLQLGEDLSRITQLAYHPRRHILASGSADGRIGLWGFQGTSPQSQFSSLSAPISCLAWSPDGTTLAAGSEDGLVVLMETC
jgi:WD40 repeat protein